MSARGFDAAVCYGRWVKLPVTEFLAALGFVGLEKGLSWSVGAQMSGDLAYMHTLFMDRLCLTLFCQPFVVRSSALLVLMRIQS